ncbi:MAG: DNA primase [Thermoguttaceae bacterium]
MSQSSYENVKEQIRDAVDIVELVSRFVPLRRSGRLFVGRCPWHDDSRPSLQVNPDRQSYKCWVCNVGGDIFSFMMQMEKVDFKEALEILADIAGIALPSPKQRLLLNRPVSTDKKNGTIDPNDLLLEASQEEQDWSDVYAGQLDDRSSVQSGFQPNFQSGDREGAKQPEISKRTLYQVMDWVQKEYHKALLTLDEAANAREYLKERGITQQSIEQFQLGYAPLERDWLLKRVERHTRRIAYLEAVGILAVSQDESGRVKQGDRYYDRFRGRLLFPIRDTQDRTIAFGGRLLPGSTLQSRAKYINSPETPLFSKQRSLYGLDIARLTIRNSRRVLIMEGYTDCIMSHQVGLSDSVAILGTALGAEHIRILKRFAEKMILVLDGDEAGQKRANEVLELFVAQGADLSILTLPEGADPCEFLLENGKETFEQLLKEEGIDALEHAFRTAVRGIDLKEDVIGSSQALDRLISVIASTPEGMSRDDPAELRLAKTINRLSIRFQIAENEIYKRLKSWKQKRSQTATGWNRRTDSGLDSGTEGNETDSTTESDWSLDYLERELLELWFADPGTFNRTEELIPDDWIQSALTREIQKTWRQIRAEWGECHFERLLLQFDDPGLKNILVELDESASKKGLDSKMEDAKRERYILEIVQGFTRRDTKRRNPQSISLLKGATLSREEKQQKLHEILQQRRDQQGVEETSN